MNHIQKQIQYLYNNLKESLTYASTTYRNVDGHELLLGTTNLRFLPNVPEAKTTNVTWSFLGDQLVDLKISRTVELDTLVKALDDFVENWDDWE